MSGRQHELPPNLPPRGLRRQEAAEYIGLSASKFDQLVLDGRMPSGKRVDGRVIWDRLAIDRAFEALSANADDRNEWDEVSSDKLSS